MTRRAEARADEPWREWKPGGRCGFAYFTGWHFFRENKEGEFYAVCSDTINLVEYKLTGKDARGMRRREGAELLDPSDGSGRFYTSWWIGVCGECWAHVSASLGLGKVRMKKITTGVRVESRGGEIKRVAVSGTLVQGDPILVHAYECLPGESACTICGRLSVDRRGDLHGFREDRGEVERAADEARELRQWYRRQPGVNYSADDWKEQHVAAFYRRQRERGGTVNRFAAAHVLSAERRAESTRRAIRRMRAGEVKGV